MVTSCYRYSISALLPWFIYPIVILILSELPVIQTLKRLLIIVPVILFIGIGNIFFNNNEVVVFGIKTTFGISIFYNIYNKEHTFFNCPLRIYMYNRHIQFSLWTYKTKASRNICVDTCIAIQIYFSNYRTA